MNYSIAFAIISLFFILANAENPNASPGRIACYLKYFGKYERIINCTYLILRRGSLNAKTGKIGDSFDRNLQNYRGYKFLLHVDPRSVGNLPYRIPQVIVSVSGRSQFIRSAVSLIKKNGYHGLDLLITDEYFHETNLLVAGLRQEFDKHGFILSGLIQWNDSFAYNPPTDFSDIARNLDFISIACFEDTKYKPETYLIAPLYSNEGSSVSSIIETYISKGVPRNKILMGIQTYAVTHTLDDADIHYVGAPAQHGGWRERPSNPDSFLELSQVNHTDWMKHRDNLSKAPYAVNYLQWASFEDDMSVSFKVQYIKENGLGGAMLYPSLKLDNMIDFPYTDLIYGILNEA